MNVFWLRRLALFALCDEAILVLYLSVFASLLKGIVMFLKMYDTPPRFELGKMSKGLARKSI